jgi:hypothetical protein
MSVLQTREVPRFDAAEFRAAMFGGACHSQEGEVRKEPREG